ncbi:hypothetical protein ACP4OV_004278 [Aristida adscensionis]
MRNRCAESGGELLPEGRSESTTAETAMSSRDITSGNAESSHGNQEIDSCADQQSENNSTDDEVIVLDQNGSAENCLVNKKLRSKVWKEFELTVVEGSLKAICNHCNQHLVAGNKNGTSHLKYHIKACPVLQSSKKRKIITPKAEIPSFDQQQSREDMARMIVAHSYPFCMTEHYYTRRFICRLQPFFKMGHRTSATENCVGLYDLEKDNLYAILDKNASRVSLTSDLWTATEKSSYMSLTVHYITSRYVH